MKTLLVRAGIEIVENTFRGPWPSELAHMERLYKDNGELYRGLIQYATTSHAGSIAVGTILKNLGENVEYLDASLEFGLPLTDELIVKKGERIKEYIADGGYDVVGISCTSALEGVATRRIAEAAKEVQENVTVLVGGYQAVAEAFDMMKKIPAIDVIVLSDMEPIAEQLYEALHEGTPVSKTPNIMYREGSRICTSEKEYSTLHPEDLPIYDYSLVKEYIPKYSLFSLEASRGCLYACSFCQENVVRKSYTVKDAHILVEETIDTVNYIGHFVDTVVLMYCDALWGANRKWLRDFCSELADRRDEIIPEKFGWDIEGRVGQFNSEALALMKKAGCLTIGYGVESLRPQMLKIINKTEAPEKYIASVFDTVDKTLRENIHAVLLFILGLPGETPSTIEETLGSMERLPLENRNLHLKIGLPILFRGTPLDKQIRDPQFVEGFGTAILAENDWEKAYFPRHSLLFDPSRELSASEMVDIYLDIVSGNQSSSASFGNQISYFGKLETIVNKNEISPDNLAEMGNLLVEIVSKS